MSGLLEVKQALALFSHEESRVGIRVAADRRAAFPAR
jgi:hypothetical protein